MRSETDEGKRSSLRTLLVERHHTVEIALDLLAAGVPADLDQRFSRTDRIIRDHYADIEPLLATLARKSVSTASKILAQHAEAMEIADAIGESIAAGHQHDVVTLISRFVALVRHNMIETERDLLPIAERCLSPEESNRFLRYLS